MHSVRYSKYGNKKTVFNGRKFDSKFEAGRAKDLELLKSAGEITDYECQYKVYLPVYDINGNIKHTVTHKVDFRIHEKDGSFTLLEAKGFETPDYRFRKMLLEKVWLPEHPDHSYTIVYQSKPSQRWRK